MLQNPTAKVVQKEQKLQIMKNVCQPYFFIKDVKK